MSEQVFDRIATGAREAAAFAQGKAPAASIYMNGHRYISADRAEALAAENKRLREALDNASALIRWAHDSLYEVNIDNYDHDEVAKLNDASVEVILGLAPFLGEKHGKTDEWWAARTAVANGGAG